MKNTLQIGKFYNVEGQLAKFKGWKTSFNGDETFFDFELVQQVGKRFRVFNSKQAEEKAFSKIVGWMQERLIKQGKSICQSKLVESFEEVTDADSIAKWEAGKAMVNQSIADFYKRNPQLNHD